MNRESELAYFERRAREEWEKAENAPDPVRHRKHLDFAQAYQRRLRVMYREEDPTGPHTDKGDDALRG